jgi:hypothetical protein
MRTRALTTAALCLALPALASPCPPPRPRLRGASHPRPSPCPSPPTTPTPGEAVTTTTQHSSRALAALDSLVWTSEQGELRVNGQPFHLKGQSCACA